MAESEEKKSPVPVQGPFVHQLKLFLVGGQTFTLNEVTETTDIPTNVVAFINAWREKKDVWHSPNNDPRFGVRVRDVSLYEYHVGRPAVAAAPQQAENTADEEVAQETKKKSTKKATK